MTDLENSKTVQCHKLLCNALDAMIAGKIEDGFPQGLTDFIATVQAVPEYRDLIDAETIKRIGTLA